MRKTTGIFRYPAENMKCSKCEEWKARTVTIEMSGGSKESRLVIGTVGLDGLSVLLPEFHTYADESNSRSFIILNEALSPAGVTLDMGKGELLTLRRLEYLKVA